MTDLSLNELKDIRKEYTDRFNDLDKALSKLDTNLRKEDLMTGYEIIANIRSGIDAICQRDSYIIELVISNFESPIDKLSSLKITRDEILADKDMLLRGISDLNKDAELKEILSKRPKECTIDDCPFIKNAQKWTLIEKEIDEYAKNIDKLDKKLSKIESQMQELNECLGVYNEISSLWRYIETNMSTIKKLPHNKKYLTFEALLVAISKRGANLTDCDDFDKFIDILECQDEYNELKFRKLPSIENEIKILETQGLIITNSKDELKSLSKRYDDIEEQIRSNTKKCEEYKTILNDYRNNVTHLGIFYEKKTQYSTTYNDLMDSIKELKEISSQLEDLEDYKVKLKEKKNKLRDIDDALQPLTRERELYKMEQLKIADHKQELAAIETDMFKCEIVRSSLSVKDDGIPVGALECFMDSVRRNANALLSGAFNGSLYLEEFIINSKDFIIPYKKNGDSGIDVSFASSSERSFISLCLTLAIMEEIVSAYGIAILDEIDRGFSSDSKYKFIEILGSQVKRVGISQVFMVTHNSAFYEGYNIGYILFPGADISRAVDETDCVKIK